MFSAQFLSNFYAAYRRYVPGLIRRQIRRVLSLWSGTYSSRFFQQMDALQQASYPKVAASIMRYFDPSSVIDVGCGSGALLKVLKEMGVADCRGIEYTRVGRKVCRKRGLNVVAGDLTKQCSIDGNVDLTICLEVAEHLPPNAADQLIDNLAGGPDILIFSAAIPGQGGREHLNEQPHEYWVEKLRQRKFLLDQVTTMALRADWTTKEVVHWYTTNVMVFRKFNSH
jgi:SAM-dependent methyltransferase